MQYRHLHIPDTASLGLGLQAELDHRAAEGWRLHTLVATGRYGEGVHMVFERDPPLAYPPKGQQGTVYDDRGPVMYRSTPGQHSGPWPVARCVACSKTAQACVCSAADQDAAIERQRPGPFVGDPGYRSGGDAAAKVHDEMMVPLRLVPTRAAREAKAGYPDDLSRADRVALDTGAPE